MKRRQPSFRKAAVLLASLDAECADRLLAEMPRHQADRLREEIEQLGQIDSDEQAQVIEEFSRIGPLVPDKQPSGIELNGGSKARAEGAAPARRPLGSGESGAFHFLNGISDERLASFLSGEHPQTIAVVLSHLPPERAADVFAVLPASAQAETARRLATLAEADPEIVRELEHGLESRLASEELAKQRSDASMSMLKNILAAAPRHAKQEILANLAERDWRLAAKLNSHATSTKSAAPMSFANLAELDAAALAATIHAAESEIVVLALAGASTQLAERLLARLPIEEAKTLRFALEHLGPTRLSDVEESQRELAHVANDLEARGVISRTMARRISVAV